MLLTAEQIGDVTVVAVNADQFDASNADDFKLLIAPALEGCHKLVLDLARVQFVDSRGCGVILSCLRRLTEAGGDLKLCGVGKPVRTVFELVRMHRVCQILPTRDEAVRAFAA